jgi:hypothetical protein
VVVVSKAEMAMPPTTSVSWRRRGMLAGEGSWKVQLVRCTFSTAFMLAVVVVVVVAGAVQPGQEFKSGEKGRVAPCPFGLAVRSLPEGEPEDVTRCLQCDFWRV